MGIHYVYGYEDQEIGCIADFCFVFKSSSDKGNILQERNPGYLTPLDIVNKTADNNGVAVIDNNVCNNALDDDLRPSDVFTVSTISVAVASVVIIS